MSKTIDRKLFNRFLVASISCLLLIAFVAACGSDPTPTPVPAKAAPAAPAAAAPTATPTLTPNAAAWQKMLTGAKEEGVVRVISHAQSFYEGMKGFAEWDQNPGVKLEFFPIPGREAVARIPEEYAAGVHTHDVYLSGSSSAIRSLFPVGNILGNTREVLLLPSVVDDENWVGGLDDHWVDDVDTKGFPKNTIMPAMMAPIGGYQIDINRTLLPKGKFDTLDDFFKPEIKGKWILENPLAGGGGAPFVTEVIAVRGEDYARRLLSETEPIIVEDLRSIAEAVVRGTAPVVAGGDLEFFKQKGLADHVEQYAINLGQPLSEESKSKLTVNCCGTGKAKGDIDGWYSSSLGGPAIFAKAPNPNAAGVFLNWLLSPHGQRSWVKARGKEIVCSARSDMQNENDCGRSLFLEEGKGYASFWRITNFPMRKAGYKLATEVLGGK